MGATDWVRLILSKPPNIQCFRSLDVKYLLWSFALGVDTENFLRQAMTPTPFCPYLCSSMKVLGDKKPKYIYKKTLQVKEIRWKLWNYEKWKKKVKKLNYELCKERRCWVPLPTSNPEVLIWPPAKLFECAVRYVFVLNAKWLCDHYLLKNTWKIVRQDTLFFAVEHMKQSLKSVSLLVLFVFFLEMAVLVTVGSC